MTLDAYGRRRSSRSIPTGPGSRGGTYHLRRNEYDRAWRAAHPEYRERERLRMARRRHPDAMPSSFPRPLPEPAHACACGCACREPIPSRCGFCAAGEHEQSA